MKIIFAGTPAFAVPTLEALLKTEHHVQLVLTQPDRPTGRGQQVQYSPVKATALKHGLTVLQPPSLKPVEIQQFLAQQGADLIVVVAYGLLLPEAVLSMPRYGCINVHASLLPRWRGAAPIPYALLHGDKETGITIMAMDKGLDTGDILLQSKQPIKAQDTTQTLHDALAPLGANLLIKTLEQLTKTGKCAHQKQDEPLATHAGKISKEQAKLNWQASATLLERQVRAFNPWPVAHFECANTSLRVWAAEAIAATTPAAPGTLVAVTPEHLYIACKEGLFSPRVLQFSGRNPTPWQAVYNAKRHLFTVGNLLPS